MANTSITLIHDDGTYVPSAPSVPVVAGESVSFTTSDGSAVLLFFSPDATSVLSPPPVNPVKLATGGSVAFTFASSAPGAYSVFFGAAPPSYPSRASGVLALEVGSVVKPPPFGGPHDTTSPGS